ncbi:Uu.00g108670.m01.CDS01 [Anthostomella pinea]|uniref:Uu.00g108670.m01.CDS01 n=1 Tax=Anthostomella pinea TaxID=933095 RepID=A0AAI8VFJ0_9PEZI|nr:Uu.00g108670.m01.CDS01 [Anthostomella pinea]
MLFSSLITLGLVTAGLSSPTPWRGPHGHDAAKKVIYFLNVDPSGSSVVAIEVGHNGMLMNSTAVTSTEGTGSQAINQTAIPEAPVTADPLQGQDAVTVVGNYLFTVNSGSDTAVMYRIDPANPLHLEMVGKPMSTLGEVAMSIAYSAKLEKACVLNGGALNGVTCFCVDAKRGLVPDGVGLRKLGLNSTTPVQFVGEKGSGSDIRFTPGSEKLVATFKGDNMPATLGHILVFDVSGQGEVATKGTDNQVSPLAAPFGFVFDPNEPDLMLISDINFGGVLAKLDYETNGASLVKVQNSSTFAASCWAAYSSGTNMSYLISAMAPNFGKVDPVSGDLGGFVTFPKSLGGAFDTIIDGTTAYFLSGTSAIGVLDVASGALLQSFDYSGSDRHFWTGMAIYPNGEGYGHGKGHGGHGGW